jgi:hypothetical protein
MRISGIWLVVAAAVIETAFLMAQEAVVPGEQLNALKSQYPLVRFSLLSSFEVPETDLAGFSRSPHSAKSTTTTWLVPPEVKALDGQRASVRGYMLPLTNDGNRITEFILTASIDSCHFGTVGLMNEWILVEMAPGRSVPFPKAVPITAFGRLAVGPETDGEIVTSLYRMTADAIAIH